MRVSLICGKCGVGGRGGRRGVEQGVPVHTITAVEGLGWDVPPYAICYNPY